MEQPTIETIKVLMLGDSGVGKSCIMTRYCFGRYHDSFSTTVGVDFGMKVTHTNGRQCRVQVWDTAGQERFRGITRSYFRGAHAVLLVFDAHSSWEMQVQNLSSWLKDIFNLYSPPKEWIGSLYQNKPLVCLLGNKGDLLTTLSNPSEVIDSARGYSIANSMSLLPIVSAKTGQGVSEAMELMVSLVLHRQRELRRTLWLQGVKPEPSVKSSRQRHSQSSSDISDPTIQISLKSAHRATSSCTCPSSSMQIHAKTDHHHNLKQQDPLDNKVQPLHKAQTFQDYRHSASSYEDSPLSALREESRCRARAHYLETSFVRLRAGNVLTEDQLRRHTLMHEGQL